jgi:hypothetical protein
LLLIEHLLMHVTGLLVIVLRSELLLLLLLLVIDLHTHVILVVLFEVLHLKEVIVAGVASLC